MVAHVCWVSTEHAASAVVIGVDAALGLPAWAAAGTAETGLPGLSLQLRAPPGHCRQRIAQTEKFRHLSNSSGIPTLSWNSFSLRPDGQAGHHT